MPPIQALNIRANGNANPLGMLPKFNPTFNHPKRRITKGERTR